CARFRMVDVVVVVELLASGNALKSNNPDLIFNLVGLAIGMAGVVDESRHAEAVDHRLAVVHPEQVGDLAVSVHAVRLSRAETRAGVLQNACSFRDGRSGVNPSAVQGRRANDYGHMIWWRCLRQRASNAPDRQYSGLRSAGGRRSRSLGAFNSSAYSSIEDSLCSFVLLRRKLPLEPV